MIEPLGGPAYLWPFAVAFLVGYLLGSIPFGLLLARLAGAGDIRAIGSGNIGATNVLRTGRKGLALATLLLDAVKGFLPAWLGWRYLGPDIAVLAGAGAVIGHCFPVWLKFRGGKGVATAAGVVLALSPLVLAGGLVMFTVVLLATRIVSAASLAAALAAPVLAWWLGQIQFAELFLFLAVLVFVKHHDNIRRILKGQENQLTFGRGDRS